jgi:hypothetical protein
MGQASARCGVGERTLRRWLTEDSEFKAEYEAACSASSALVQSLGFGNAA